MALWVLMNRTGRISAALWAFMLFSASPLFGIGTPEDQGEDIFNLGEITVTATTMRPIEAGQAVHVVTAEEIKKTNARSLDEVLVLLSDVNVKMGTDGVPRVEIRGFKARNILVLLDGVPINSAFDGQFDPSAIPVDSIAKVKVTTGANSVLYGQGALGGVIDITTKKGTPQISGTAALEVGDGSPYLARSSIAGTKGKFDFFVSGSAFKRDRFPLAKSFTGTVEESAGYRVNSDYTRNNALMTIGYTPHPDLHLGFTANYVQGGYGKPASAINNNFDPYAPPARFGRVDDFEGYTFQLTVDHTPTPSLSIRSRFYHDHMEQDNNQYDDETYSTFDNVIVPNSYHVRNTATKTGTSIQPRYEIGRAGTVTLGFSGEYDRWTDSGAVKPGGSPAGAQGGRGIGAGSPPYILYPVSDDYHLSVFSTAIEYDVALSKKVGFAAGLAYHWQVRNDMTLDDYSVSTSLYYDMFRDTRLKAAYMRNIHFPTLSQLYLRNTNNPNLLTETVYQYQLGLEQKLPWNSFFRINAFQSDIYDYIGLKENVTPQEGYAPYHVNFSHIMLQGFETSVETSFVKELRMKGAHTLNVSRDYSRDDRQEVQYVPKHKFVFTGRYDFPFGLTPFLSVVYVSESFVYSKQQYVTLMKAQMADYVVVNFKLSQKLFKDSVSVYIGADNLFNKDYEDTYGIPRPGRYVYGGFEYRF